MPADIAVRGDLDAVAVTPAVADVALLALLIEEPEESLLLLPLPDDNTWFPDE